MYKAGDFSNGKMNEIFIMAHSDGVAHIKHRQLGQFRLVGADHEFASLSGALEDKFGIFVEKTNDGLEFKSILSPNSKHHDNIDNYKTKNLINGLFLLSGHVSLVGRAISTSVILMQIICADDYFMSVNHIGNGNTKDIKKAALKNNNSLDEDLVDAFLNGCVGKRSRMFADVCNSILSVVMDSNPREDAHWNSFSFSSVYFHVKENVPKFPNQESFAACMAHLLSGRVISQICADEFMLTTEPLSIGISNS